MERPLSNLTISFKEDEIGLRPKGKRLQETPEADVQLQVKECSCRENPSSDFFDHGLLTSRSVRSLQSVGFVSTALEERHKCMVHMSASWSLSVSARPTLPGL